MFWLNASQIFTYLGMSTFSFLCMYYSVPYNIPWNLLWKTLVYVSHSKLRLIYPVMYFYLLSCYFYLHIIIFSQNLVYFIFCISTTSFSLSFKFKPHNFLVFSVSNSEICKKSCQFFYRYWFLHAIHDRAGIYHDMFGFLQ